MFSLNVGKLKLGWTSNISMFYPSVELDSLRRH